MFNLPLETKENPKGVYTAEELYMVLSTIFTAVFVDIDPVKSYPLRQAAKDVATQLGQLIEANVKGVTGFGIRSLFGSPNKDDPLYEYGAELIKGLYKGGKTAGDITWSQILPAATAAVPTMAEAVGCPRRLHDSECSLTPHMSSLPKPLTSTSHLLVIRT